MNAIFVIGLLALFVADCSAGKGGASSSGGASSGSADANGCKANPSILNTCRDFNKGSMCSAGQVAMVRLTDIQKRRDRDVQGCRMCPNGSPAAANPTYCTDSATSAGDICTALRKNQACASGVVFTCGSTSDSGSVGLTPPPSGGPTLPNASYG